MAVPGTVRSWRDEEGWGVIDSAATPGGCWTHFSHVAGAGFRRLTPGQPVELVWEAPGQDGYAFRAVRVWPEGTEPGAERETAPNGPCSAYRSELTISRDEPGRPGVG